MTENLFSDAWLDQIYQDAEEACKDDVENDMARWLNLSRDPPCT